MEEIGTKTNRVGREAALRPSELPRRTAQGGVPARRRIPVGIILAALSAFAIAWFLMRPQAVMTELATVVEGSMVVTVDNQGQVRIHDRYVIAAPVAARMDRVELHDGDPVRKGQTVAVLYPLPLDAPAREAAQARLSAARALAREAGSRTMRADADLRLAISERTRMDKLASENFVSKQATEKAVAAEAASRAEAQAARSREVAAAADVRGAEAALLAADVAGKGGQRPVPLEAPVDGYVLKVYEKSEHIVAAGTPLVTLADPSRYEIVVDVLSTDAVKIRPGNTMLLEGWGGGHLLHARVRLVEPVAFTKVSALGVEEQRVNVIADPVDALWTLGDGYRIEARIVLWETKNALKLPGSSLFRVGDAWHVYVVENGQAREREVMIGQRNQDEAQVLAGLEAGTTVVRYPGNALHEGSRITPLR